MRVYRARSEVMFPVLPVPLCLVVFLREGEREKQSTTIPFTLPALTHCLVLLSVCGDVCGEL